MKPLLFLFIPVLFSCGNNREEVKAEKETITESVYASGIVKSRNQYQVFPAASGIITDIPVTEGDIVKKDQVIMRIDNSTARLNTENARLAAEYSDVNANRDKLSDLLAAVNLAKSKMQNDSLLFIRQQKLHEQHIGSEVEFEQRKLASENSQTAYESAVIRYREMKKQIEFTAGQSKNNLRISSTLSDDFNIRSQIDGKVYSILKEKGEMVNMQTPVAVIGDAKDFYLELQVDEYDISRVKPGQKVLITMDSYKDRVFDATVSKVDPFMNERTKSFRIEAELTLAPETLFPNLTAEANIIIQTHTNTVTIPTDYLTRDSFVILKGDKKQAVKTGLRDYRKTEILSGLNAGDVILKPEK